MERLIRGETDSKYTLSTYGPTRIEVAARLLERWKTMYGEPQFAKNVDEFMEQYCHFETVTTEYILCDGSHHKVPDPWDDE